MDTCFVIQPFDKDKFDKRYIDIFEPAIRLANLEPYRVDRDPSVRVPIDQIEEGIRKAKICFAEITLDNPNVWYELGFAFASKKDVVMICSDERINRFPFDVQHKHIISYKTSSKSDFDILEKSITEKLIALLSKQKNVQTIIENPVKESEGLKPHELTMMILILENQLTEEDYVSVYSIQSDMESAGFTKAASNIAIRELQRKAFINTFRAPVDYGEDYLACRLTENGENWILTNQDKIEFKKQMSNDSDDLPF